MYDRLRQTAVLLVALLVVTTGGAVGATAAPSPDSAETPAVVGTPLAQVANDTATVTFDDQETDGESVTVQSATVPDGGYVAVHDADSLAGTTPDNVIGNTSYLAPGTSANLTVSLDEALAANATLVAVAYQETNQANDTANATFDYVSSDGADDVPYPTGDSANVTVPDDEPAPAPNATVTFDDQETDGAAVTVSSVNVSEGGYVTIHDASLLDGNVVGSVVGNSSYLGPGETTDLTVELSEPITENQTLIAMPHRETNQANDTANATYDFVTSNGTDDGPYLVNGTAVTDAANVTVAAGNETPPDGNETPATGAVTFDDQTTDGASVVVTSATLSEGGYVVVHDASAADGNVTPESVLGNASYRTPGTYENVTVELDEPVTENQTLVAVPHLGTNQNATSEATFDYVATNGTEDVPYADNGTPVTDSANVTVTDDDETPPTAAVTFDDQQTDGTTVTVSSVELSEGGYVAIHDDSLLDGNVVGSVVGNSSYLPAGTSENVSVTLSDPINESQTLIAMPHRETNQANDTANATYDFVTSNGTDDGPYLANGSAVTDDANVTVEQVVEPDGEFDVSALGAPTTAVAGQTIVVSALVENTGNASATEDVEFRLAGDVVLSQSVTLDAGESRRVVFDVDTTGVAPGDYNHGVFADVAGETARLTVVATRSLDVSNLSAPATAETGDTVEVSALITNPNAEQTRQAVDFRLDGDVTRTRQLTLAANEERTVTFTVDTAGLAPGTYIHGVTTRERGDFAVLELTDGTNGNETPANASITFDDQTTDGSSVVVADATNTSAPFYVAVWNTTATGEPEAVLGFDQVTTNTTSDVTVELLNDSVTENQTLVAAVHPDADGNDSTAGDPVVDTLLATDTAAVTVLDDGDEPPAGPSATVAFDEQESDGENVTVSSTTLSEGGYVTIHDDGLLDGDAVGSVVGVSSYLPAGTSENVSVTLSDPINGSQTLIAMPHRETNQANDTANATYDFVTSNGTDDGPYLVNGTAVTDAANVTVAAGNETPPDGNETPPDGNETPANASITFDDQTTDGSSAVVADATNASATFYVGVWTLTPNGTPDQILGLQPVVGTETLSAQTVVFDNATLTTNQTLVAAVHPDADGSFTTLDDAETDTLLATDTANVTVAATNETNGSVAP